MTFGESMRARMAEREISLRNLSKMLPADLGYLSKISRDIKRPSAEMADRIDEALNAGGDLAALRPVSGVRRTSTGDDLDLLGGISQTNGQPVDAAFVDSIRQTSQSLVKLDTLHGGDDAFPLALRAFRQAHQKLSTGAYAPKVERDLMAATGESGEVAAWLAYDADQQGASRQIIHEALMLSRQAGDRDMELFELGHLAMQSVYLHRPAEALRIARDVLDRRGLSPRIVAMFEIRCGRALAQMHDPSGASAAFARSRSLVADGVGSRDPYWTWWLTDAEVDWHQAMGHAELGDWASSVSLFEDAARRRPALTRARYNGLTHLLDALVHVQDWREVEPVLIELAGQVGEVGSTRTTNLLRRTVRRVETDHAPSAVVDAAEFVCGVLLEQQPSGQSR